MNRLKNSSKAKYYFLFIALTFVSCKKVIPFNLNSKDPQTVIEALVTDDTLTPQTVKITKSINLSESNTFPTVSGASVNLSDNYGNSVILTETSPGIYQNSTLQGFSGRTYYLKIIVEGKNYSSVCSMPGKVLLDTILIIGHSEKVATPIFHDPIGRGNRYRFKLQKNNIVSDVINLFDDEILDGITNNRPLNTSHLSLKKFDTLRIEMMCIDKTVYAYFTRFIQNGGGLLSSTIPANPISNITGGAIGYFSAHTVQIKEVIIP